MSGLLRILTKHPDVGRHIRPRVEEAVAAMERGQQPSLVDLAGACLGNSYQTVRALTADGSLPSLLDERSRDRLQGMVDDALDAYVAVLGLPAGRMMETAEPAKFADPGYGLFPHQVRAVRRLRFLLRRAGLALLHMPTGAGKTRTTMNLVCEILRETDHTVLWMASTRELCEQAVSEFQEAWSFLGNRRVPVHPMWGGREWEVRDIHDGFAVATPQTLHSRLNREGGDFAAELGQKVGLIVFDEAHQIVAPTYQTAVMQLSAAGTGGNTPIVGLSATPGRTFEGAEGDRRLAQFFEGNKVLLETGHEGARNPVRYLIENQYLADPDFRLLTPSGLAASGDVIDASLFDPEDDEDLQMNPVEYVRLVADAVHELVEEGHRRILVFAASVELSEDIAAALSATGLIAEGVHAHTDSAMRAAAIERYRAEGTTPRVLVNYAVLTAGFDAPRTSAAVIARPTKSLVMYSQMVGRAIRGKKQGGNEQATIVTVVDPEVPAFGSIAEAFMHWEDHWS